MPESFIPVWLSIGEAEEFRRFLQEEARSDDGEFPEREYALIDGALTEEKPRTFDQMQAESAALSKLARTRAMLEAIQGDAYLWQSGDSPFEAAAEVIEHLRKSARDVLHELDLDKQPAPLTQQPQPLSVDQQRLEAVAKWLFGRFSQEPFRQRQGWDKLPSFKQNAWRSAASELLLASHLSPENSSSGVDAGLDGRGKSSCASVDSATTVLPENSSAESRRNAIAQILLGDPRTNQAPDHRLHPDSANEIAGNILTALTRPDPTSRVSGGDDEE